MMIVKAAAESAVACLKKRVRDKRSDIFLNLKHQLRN